MKIDITKLLTNSVDIIDIDDNINIPNDILDDERINYLENVKFNGNIVIDEDNNLVVSGKLTGTMNLKDDITLEPVDYQLETDIEDKISDVGNILDITDILYQNIVVEIPSKVRATDSDIELSGDGWRVISEDTYNKERKNANNPFTNLDELLEIKEEK